MGALIELPEGPVTVMFTDIEGSTALRTTLGDAEADALFGRHDELVRSEIEAHRGYDFQAALGDGFLAVFVSTRRAIACAVAIQQALERFSAQRRGAPLRVRIGLNTGEVAWAKDQPSGEAIHAASRVCAAADGGEVFVSDVTRQLAGTVPDITFSDRGEHTLKGFPQPWKLWSLAWRSGAPERPDQVFVARDGEFAMLRGLLDSALEGRGGLVLIGGEPGVGKTTLTKELIKDAEARGAVALFGRCYESEGAVPYSPFVEMIEQALRVVPAEWMLEDMGEDAPEVARMIPELRRRFPDIGEPLDLPPEQQRRYFFNAVSAFLSRAAARLPMVIVLDDVHWADEPTLLLIEHVAEQLKQLRILGVGTYRDVELDVSRPLAATLERLLRTRAGERISLQRFDAGGVGQMLSELAGREVPEALVRAVFAETEGNPFFVEEVFRHFVEEGKVFDESGQFRSDIHVDELDVPESVRLVVGRRLERLGPVAQKALAAAAVVGRAFSFRLWESVADIDSDTLLDVVDEAETARVIVPEEKEGDAHYTFAHELIRQTLLSSLTIPRRQRLHLVIANAMERLDPGGAHTRPSEIATHLVEAGVAADRARTVEYLTISVDRALEAAAFEDAARLIDSALAMLPADDALRRTQLLERLGQTQRAMGHFEDAIATWREVIDGYVAAGDIEAAGRVNFDRGYLLTYLARFPEALANSQEALDVLGDAVTPYKAMILGGRGAILAVAGLHEMADDLLAQADAVAPNFGPEVRGRVSWTRCVGELAAGRLVDAERSGRRAIETLEESNDAWTLADAIAWQSNVKCILGKWAEAAELADHGLALCDRLGHVGAGVINAMASAASHALLDGDLARYEADARAVIATIETFRTPFEANIYSVLGVVLQLRGQLEDARQTFDRAAEVEFPSAFSGHILAFQAINASLTDPGTCASLLRDRLPEIVAPGVITPGRSSLVLGATEAAAIARLEPEAGELLEVIRRRLPPDGTRLWDGGLPSRVAGMAAAVVGEWEAAEAYFNSAVTTLAALPNVIEKAHVDHWYARMLIDRGRPEDQARAVELVGSALEAYERFAMPVYAAMARELHRVRA